MNGAHDLGGMHGFGPIDTDPDDPLFHAEWERRAFAVTLALGALGRWNLDMTRFAREQTDPAAYLARSYYEHWLYGLSRLIPAAGLATPEEMTSGVISTPPAAVTPLAAEAVRPSLARGSTARRPESQPPCFKVGDAVTAKLDQPAVHTRLPRYARGRPGVIVHVHGVFVLPDTNANGIGENPEWCYNVRFRAQDLWGATANPRDSIHIDLWESYLDRTS